MFPPPSLRRDLRLTAIALALSTVVGATHAQFVSPPAAAMDAGWARAYRSCTEREVIRRLAPEDAHSDEKDIIESAEKACQEQLPGAGLGFGEGPPAAIAAARQVRLAVHRDLSSRFHRDPTAITTTLTPPLGAGRADPDCPRPDYPAAAVRSLAQGETRVRLTVDERGHVTHGEIVQSSGPSREHRMLDNAALDTFTQCVFAAHAGEAPRTLTLSYVWKID